MPLALRLDAWRRPRWAVGNLRGSARTHARGALIELVQIHGAGHFINLGAYAQVHSFPVPRESHHHKFYVEL